MKITANIATYPPRRESLIKMLKSIEGQFDEIRIYFNYPEGVFLPDITIDTSNIICNVGWMGHDYTNLSDNGKFWMLDKIKEPEIYFTLDDDIIYPRDYVEKTVHGVNEYGIVTYHGRQLKGKGLEYFKGHRWFRCFDGLLDDCLVDVCGTGVTAFRTDYFHPKGLADSKDLGMADLVFSLEAAKQNKQIVCLSHQAGWIKPIHNEETLYGTERRKGGIRQRQIADEIFELRHEND